jgi:hypothetical protein
MTPGKLYRLCVGVRAACWELDQDELETFYEVLPPVDGEGSISGTPTRLIYLYLGSCIRYASVNPPRLEIFLDHRGKTVYFMWTINNRPWRFFEEIK